MRLKILGLTLFLAASAQAQTLNVKIINRQDSLSDYTYFVPGQINATTNSNEDGSSWATNGTVTPAYEDHYQVSGATFTLLLPDGRRAVVNCRAKVKGGGFARAAVIAAQGQAHLVPRSCRIPLVDDIQADFHGKDAKLIWVVSLDGKKTQSETYDILAILPR